MRRQEYRVQPVVLERLVVEKVWGGQSLANDLGIALPTDIKVGETWELYDREAEGSNPVRDSEFSLHDLVAKDPMAWLGPDIRPTPNGRFPLMVKYIDASERLSVQVHPDDLGARRDADLGKHEAWVVLATRSNARVIKGFKQGVTSEQALAVLDKPEIEHLLHAFVPNTGDAIRIPAGMPHALGPGVTIFEVQQNSDLTYRMYDWGRPRELHLDRARDTLRFDQYSPEKVPSQVARDGSTWLIRDTHFRVRQVRVEGSRVLTTGGTFKILNLVGGNGSLGWEGGGLKLLPGDTVLVPASIGWVSVAAQSPCNVLWTSPGDALRIAPRLVTTTRCAPPRVGRPRAPTAGGQLWGSALWNLLGD